MSKDLHHAGKNSYYFTYILIISQLSYNLHCFDVTCLTNAKIKHYVGIMQQKYVLYWQHTMQNCNKLFQQLFSKGNHSPSSYLGLTFATLYLVMVIQIKLVTLLLIFSSPTKALMQKHLASSFLSSTLVIHPFNSNASTLDCKILMLVLLPIMLTVQPDSAQLLVRSPYFS